MNPEVIKPNFYYNCEGELTTLDCQYSCNGEKLALSFSNGTIQIYNSQRQMNCDEADKNYVCKYSDINHIFSKLAWSFSQPSLLTAVSISKEIFCFKINSNQIQYLRSIKTCYIPIFICFYPSISKNILTVGFAGGFISLYNEKLKVLSSINPHKEGVNWLSWEHHIYPAERNKWALQNFPSFFNNKQQDNEPLLASGSSDKFVKIWVLRQKNQLFQLYSFEAHSRQIRQIVWKPLCFTNHTKYLVSCSEDGNVRIWSFSQKKPEIKVSLMFDRNYGGPVYRAEYNHLGTLLVIRYYKAEQEKIVTKIFKEKKGILTQQEIKIEEEEKPPN